MITITIVLTEIIIITTKIRTVIIIIMAKTVIEAMI